MAINLNEKKKKKDCSNISYTTGDIGYNIKQFNKRMGTDFNNPSTEEAKANKAAEQACAKVGTFVAASPDGGSSISTGETSSGEACGESLGLKETVATSMPVIILPESTILDFVSKHITTNPTNPNTFKLGYIKEFSNEIAGKFRGGRGSAGYPLIRIFKCIEYSALYTGIAWTMTDKTIAADTMLGTARHTGEKTGFSFSSGLGYAIGNYPDGSKALQAYIADNSIQRIKYLVSIDDSDLAEIDRKDLLPYLTPSAGVKLLAPAAKAAGVDASGNAIYDRPINRLKLANIYMIGDQGTNLM